MAARDAGDPPIPVDQAVFTDGLATISDFIEPAEKNTRKEGAGSTGATHVLVKRRGDYWITVLGEVLAPLGIAGLVTILVGLIIVSLPSKNYAGLPEEAHA